MNKILLLIILIDFCSCAKQRELTGTWQVKNYNLWERGVAFLNGARQFTNGTKLILNSDSTYKETTCGNVIIGKWKVKGDSLILNSDTTWYLMAKWFREHVDVNYDSLTGICYHDHTSFLIKRNKLVSYYNGTGLRLQADGSTKSVDIRSMEILK